MGGEGGGGGPPGEPLPGIGGGGGGALIPGIGGGGGGPAGVCGNPPGTAGDAEKSIAGVGDTGLFSLADNGRGGAMVPNKRDAN